jgi:hypothetical protein
MPIRTHWALRVAAAALGCAVLAGCAPGTENSSGAPRPQRSPVEKATSAPADPGRSASSAAATSPADPAPSATAPGPAATLEDRLLAGSEVPSADGAGAWADGTTSRQEPGGRFGTCQKFAMTSIGAMRVVVRAYAPSPAADDVRAGELVAQFADPDTAARAFEVLKSWRAQCGEELADDHDPRVGALQDVSVPGGAGGWYLLSYGPAAGQPGARWYDAQGMARVGNRIALVALAHAATGHGAPEPSAVAGLVAAAGGRLS